MQEMISALSSGMLGIVFSSRVNWSSPVWIIKPLDVSRADQSVSAEFVVKKAGDYSFSLAFKKDDDYNEILKQKKIWGNSKIDGVSIPINLRILQDGQVFFNKDMKTGGAFGGKVLIMKGVDITQLCAL